MAGTDDDDDIFGEESSVSATLREQFAKLTEGQEPDEADTGGFDAPLDGGDTQKRETVSEEEGIRRVQDARGPKPKEKVTLEKPPSDAKPDDAPAATPPVVEAQADPSAPVAPVQPVAAVPDADIDAALTGLAAPVRERITAERAEYAAMTAPFKGREAEFAPFGLTPKDVVGRFIQLNDYSQRDPGGYIAWAVQQTTGGDAEKVDQVFQKAAAALGYKVERAPEPDEDDPFMSDRERALIAENRALKQSTQSAPAYGPDSPEEQARVQAQRVSQDIAGFAAARDATGAPLRPHFEMLAPTIGALATIKAKELGRNITMAELAEIYTGAELADPRTRAEAAKRIAAQSDATAVQKTNTDAAATARAKAASSKILDGSGQGAERQPAQEDADLGIEAFLRKQMAASRQR